MLPMLLSKGWVFEWEKKGFKKKKEPRPLEKISENLSESTILTSSGLKVMQVFPGMKDAISLLLKLHFRINWLLIKDMKNQQGKDPYFLNRYLIIPLTILSQLYLHQLRIIGWKDLKLNKTENQS